MVMVYGSFDLDAVVVGVSQTLEELEDLAFFQQALIK